MVDLFHRYIVNPVTDSAKWTQDEFNRLADYLWEFGEWVADEFNAHLAAYNPHDKMTWRDPYVYGDEYYKSDTVKDGNWSMVCAVPVTTDRAAPQPTGDPDTYYKGIIGTDNQLAKQILFGTRYDITFAGAFYILSYRIYAVTGNNYTTYQVKDPDGEAVVQELHSFTADTTGWVTFSIPAGIVITPVTFEMLAIVQEPAPTPTIWVGNWNYLMPNNVVAPLAGQITHSNKALGVIGINVLDSDGGDRGAELRLLTVGDIINGAGMSWSIQIISDQTTHLNFSVAPSIQGNATGIQEFSFETVTPTPITYAVDTDYYLSDPIASGLLGVDTDVLIPDDNAYGMDVTVQDVIASSDWDLLAFSDIAGGGNSAQRLTDEETSMTFIGEWYPRLSRRGTVAINVGQAWIATTLTSDEPKTSSPDWEKV
jgi:hypothetical protein